MRQQVAKRGKKHVSETVRKRRRRRDASSRRETVIVAAATLGAVGAGVALLEAAALPALALGGAAVLAPRLWRDLRRRRKSSVGPPAPAPSSDPGSRLVSLPGFKVTQALAKTITYRVIITACDFSWNYVILGEAGAAAGLSTISLAAGPISYFIHEAGWNRYGPRFEKNGLVTVSLPRIGWRQHEKATLAVGRPIAKTVTFRTLGTVMEFATNYAVVRDLATATALTAFGFVLGPFIYLGHEKAWELANAPKSKGQASGFLSAKPLPAPSRLAPASA